MIGRIEKIENFETRCVHCGTIFRFEYEDFENNRESDDIYGDEAVNEYVICPVCGAHNTVRRSFNGNVSKIVENIGFNWAPIWQDKA